ncbi:MAG UNVERIFIED_CONTAM: hypothetical protein LVR18_38315 [Planctomycetaceae bacterium]
MDRTKPIRKTDVIREAFIPTNTYETPTSIGLGEYTWWVRAYDGDDNPGSLECRPELLDCSDRHHQATLADHGHHSNI